MSDFDNDFFSRQGPTVGHANENRLLQKVGGANTTRKTFQTNADGSVTMLHTRGPGTQPEVITTQPAAQEEPRPILEDFLVVPESAASPWGFYGVGGTPMIYPDENSPGSTRVFIKPDASVKTIKNNAWVVRSADATYAQHPGNAWWTDDRLPVAKRKRLSWWRPANAAAFGTGTPAAPPIPGLGDGGLWLDTSTGNWYFSYAGTRANLGEVFIDGVKTYTMNRVILAAAMAEVDGVRYIRFVSPTMLAGVSPAYAVFYNGVTSWEYNTVTGVTVSKGATSPYSYYPADDGWPEFNASATKFILPRTNLNDSLEITFSTNAQTALKTVFMTGPDYTISVTGTVGATSGLAGEVTGYITAKGTPSSAAGFGITTTHRNLAAIWYVGDALEGGVEVLTTFVYDGSFDGGGTFSGLAKQSYIEMTGGVTVPAVNAYINVGTIKPSGVGVASKNTYWAIETGYTSSNVVFYFADKGLCFVTSIDGTGGVREAEFERSSHTGLDTVTIADPGPQPITKSLTVYDFYRRTGPYEMHTLTGLPDDVEPAAFPRGTGAAMTDARDVGILALIAANGGGVIKLIANGVMSDITSLLSVDSMTYIVAPIYVRKRT